MKFDAAAFARRQLYEKVNVSQFLLTEPKTFRYVKPFTYEKFTKMHMRHPVSDQVYEILVHHTHETFRNTLLCRLQGESDKVLDWGAEARTKDTDSNDRVIRLEGGWLY
jgi:hypothetical protein